MEKKHGIIGMIYHQGFKRYRLASTVSEYFSLVLGISDINDPTMSGIMQYDYFTKTIHPKFKEELGLKDECIGRIKSYVNKLNQEQKNLFNDLLISIINSLDKYPTINIRTSTQEINPSYYDSYSKEELLKLKTFFTAKPDTCSLEYNIYSMLYLAVHKTIEPKFFYGPNHSEQLTEFNNEVTCKYGTTSKPGIRAIIDLATRKEPNIFALYEYADILYYGREYGPKKNINEAFKTYEMLSTTNNHSSCHPLALWSLSYIYFNYHQPKTELEFCDSIKDIDALSRYDQVMKAAEYAVYAYTFTNNAASANILGKISLLTEEDLPGIEIIKKHFSLKEPIEYFQEAVDQNYIYAYGNLSWIYLEKIFNDGKNKQEENLDRYLGILTKQAEQNEPWAANTLGVFYHDGIARSKKTQNELSFKRIDFEKSFLYFNMAINSDFTDQNSGWAIANILIFFPDRFYENPSIIESYVRKLIEINNVKAIEFFKKNFEQIYKELLIPKIMKKISKLLE